MRRTPRTSRAWVSSWPFASGAFARVQAAFRVALSEADPRCADAAALTESPSEDKTIDPPTSAIFSLVNQTDLTPIALERLPLYRKDYIGLRKLDQRGALDRNGVCIGEHMQIVRCEGFMLPLTAQDEDCWTMVLDHLAPSVKSSPRLLVQAGSRA